MIEYRIYLSERRLPVNFFLKPKLGRICLTLIIGYFLSLLIFYIPNYVMESTPIALTYLHLFFAEFISFITVSLAVVYLYHLCIIGKPKYDLILSAVALGATGCIYNLPYYYLFETAVGYDWIESTLSSMLICSFIASLDALKMLLFTLIASKLSYRFSGKRERNAHSALILKGDGKGVTMLERPEQKAFFGVSLGIFLYSLIFEISDVVSHLVQYGSFRNSELIYVVSKFVFLIILLISSYVLQCLLYNCYRKAHKDDKKA